MTANNSAARFGAMLEVTPLDALKQELHRSAEWVTFLEDRQPSHAGQGDGKRLTSERKMLVRAERICRQVGLGPGEIDAIKAAGAAEGAARAEAAP